MSSTTWLTMLVVLGIVWGGFLFCLLLAFQKERRKTREPGDQEYG